MNVGPALGVAAATTLRGLGGGAGLPLAVLAGVAGAGAVAGRVLPGRRVLPGCAPAPGAPRPPAGAVREAVPVFPRDHEA
ncbi:hypothetical protein [Streptomyces spiralis]|uniref:hypothetical protein n=1 Tax=Streptomyces spiralis TaxID=66376 RepID=UPI00367CC2A9